MCFCVAFFSVIVALLDLMIERPSWPYQPQSQSKHNDIVQVSTATPATSVENIRLEHGFLYSF